MAKPASISGYDEGSTILAERVLLEVWSRLGEYREHLVLIGGLVPRYLVDQKKQPPESRHCGTMDVDLGISIAVADIEVYEGIAETLKNMGFEHGRNEKGKEQKHSFVKKVGTAKLILDFLTTKYHGPENSRMRNMQENLSAIQVEGLGLAFSNPLKIKIKGKLISGGLTKETVNVCRPIPFVVLKALAYEKRREPKDVYDMVYVLLNYKGGPSAMAKKATPAERKTDSFRNALSSLKRHFETTSHNGPDRYASFLGDKTRAAQAFAAVQGFLKGLKQLG
jgi:hypothetical protein